MTPSKTVVTNPIKNKIPMVTVTLNCKNATLFRGIVDAIGRLSILDCNLVWTDQGLTINAMDPSHVSLVALVLNREFFQTYRTATSEPEVVGVSLVTLGKILRSLHRDDSLMITTKSDQITLSVDRSGQTSVFNVPCLDIEESQVDIGSATYDNCYQIPAGLFGQSINELQLLEANTCHLAWDNDSIKLQSTGHLGETTLTIATVTPVERAQLRQDATGTTSCCVECFKSPVCGNFSLDYLQHFIQTAKLSPDQVCWKVSNDYPLNMTVTFREGSHLSFYLAPKIDTDD